MGLSLTTLKGQVSSISVFSEVKWAFNEEVVQIFKAVRLSKLNRRLLFPKLNLPLPLDYLSSEIFLQQSKTSLFLLMVKTAILVLFTSFSEVLEVVALAAPEPFLTFFEDRVVLISLLGFTLKVTSDFHCGKELVLPSYAPSASPHERLLDIVS